MHEGHRARMRERVLSGGLDNLQPHEVLEFLLFYAIPRKDTNELGHRLMKTFGSLSRVMNADTEDLMNVEGMTLSAAALLRSFPDLFKDYSNEMLNIKEELPNRAAAVKYLHSLFMGERVEKAYLICLDCKSHIINRCLLSTGIADAVNVFIREISEVALKNKAVNVILAHNHPSGNVKPSSADIELTRAAALSLKVLEVNLCDHYIIADNGFFSFKQEGLLNNIDSNVNSFLKDTIGY